MSNLHQGSKWARALLRMIERVWARLGENERVTVKWVAWIERVVHQSIKGAIDWVWMSERVMQREWASIWVFVIVIITRVNEAVKENHSFSENVIKIGSKNVFRSFTLSFRKRKQKIRRIRERKEKRKEKEKNGWRQWAGGMSVTSVAYFYWSIIL